jgi:pyruvate kinase
MRKTKIICTLGPATDDINILRTLIQSGMDVARFNFSHGTHEEQLKRLNDLKKLREELKIPVAALMDTKGPEIRLGLFEGGSAMLKAGTTFTLTTVECLGNEARVHVSYEGLPGDVKPGDRVLLDDGKISLKVKHVKGGDIVGIPNPRRDAAHILEVVLARGLPLLQIEARVRIAVLSPRE